MSLIYITGIAGAGKSAVCKELTSRGFEAHEADNSLSAFYHNETGKVVGRHVPVAERTPEWRLDYTWKMSKDGLLKLKAAASKKSIFVCGVAANEEEYIDLFDKVFALDLDLPTIRHRVETRPDSDFGKSEHEMSSITLWQQSTEEYYRRIGAHVIDASKPLPEVVDEIISNLE